MTNDTDNGNQNLKRQASESPEGFRCTIKKTPFPDLRYFLEEVRAIDFLDSCRP